MNENFLVRKRLNLFENLILWQHKLLSFIYSIILNLLAVDLPASIAVLLEDFVLWPNFFLRECQQIFKSIDDHIIQLTAELLKYSTLTNLKITKFDQDKQYEKRLQTVIQHTSKNFELHVKSLKKGAKDQHKFSLPPPFKFALKNFFYSANLGPQFEHFEKSFEYAQLVVSLINKVFIKTPQLLSNTPSEIELNTKGLILDLEEFWNTQINASIGETKEFEFSFKTTRFKDMSDLLVADMKKTTQIDRGIQLKDLSKESLLLLASHQVAAVNSKFLNPLTVRLRNSWDAILTENFDPSEAAYQPNHVVDIFTNVQDNMYNRATYAKTLPFIYEIDYAKCTSYNFFEQICLYKLLTNYLILILKSNQIKNYKNSLAPHLLEILNMIQKKIY